MEGVESGDEVTSASQKLHHAWYNGALHDYTTNIWDECITVRWRWVRAAHTHIRFKFSFHVKQLAKNQRAKWAKTGYENMQPF